MNRGRAIWGAVLAAMLGLSLLAAGLQAVTNPHGKTTGLGNHPRPIYAWCQGCVPDNLPVFLPAITPNGDWHGLFEAQIKSGGRSSDGIIQHSKFYRAMAR